MYRDRFLVNIVDLQVKRLRAMPKKLLKSYASTANHWRLVNISSPQSLVCVYIVLTHDKSDLFYSFSAFQPH
jgi:hypothetical protein